MLLDLSEQQVFAIFEYVCVQFGLNLDDLKQIYKSVTPSSEMLTCRFIPVPLRTFDKNYPHNPYV